MYSVFLLFFFLLDLASSLPFCASSCFMVLLFPCVSLHPCFSSWSGPWCGSGEMLRSLNLVLGNLQDKLLSSGKGSPFSSRIWVYGAEFLFWGDQKPSVPFLYPSGPSKSLPGPNYSPGSLGEAEVHSKCNKAPWLCLPYRGSISWSSALMRANFLSKHLKRGGAFSCHPLLGLILLSRSLRLEIKTRALASCNET